MAGQSLNFRIEHRQNYYLVEPGDGTRYKFIIVEMPEGWHGDWAPERAPFVAIASVDGPLFPGITLPLAIAQEWWYDTSHLPSAASLDHRHIEWVKGENDFRVKGGINPWTIRAAFLTLIKEFDNEHGKCSGDE